MNKKLKLYLVCVDYDDFLEHTLPINKKIFDEINIATSPEDKATQELCKKYDVNCLITDIFYRNGAFFNKGAGLNELLKLNNFSKDEFLIFTDADCAFEENFREQTPWNFLSPEIMYGGFRRFIWTYQDWLDFNNGINRENYKIIDGWGVGFGQVTSSRSSVYKRYSDFYPSNEDSANNVDISMLKRFGPVTAVGKLDFIVNHIGFHGNFHQGRQNSRLEELKNKRFKDMPDLSKHEFYK